MRKQVRHFIIRRTVEGNLAEQPEYRHLKAQGWQLQQAFVLHDKSGDLFSVTLERNGIELAMPSISRINPPAV